MQFWLIEVLLLVLALLSVMTFISEVVAMPPRNLIEKSQEGKAPSAPELMDAQRKLEKALFFNPLGASLALEAGMLYQFQALGHPQWSSKAQKLHSKATEKFKLATELRPSWGPAWAYLAQSHVLNLNTGPEAYKALERALLFSPWSFQTQRHSISLGLALWNEAPEKLQDQMKGALNRAFTDNRETLFVLHTAAMQGKENMIRPMLPHQKALDALECVLEAREKKADDRYCLYKLK